MRQQIYNRIRYRIETLVLQKNANNDDNRTDLILLATEKSALLIQLRRFSQTPQIMIDILQPRNIIKGIDSYPFFVDI